MILCEIKNDHVNQNAASVNILEPVILLSINAAIATISLYFL